MKLVKESLNEIKRNIEGSGLGAIGIGKAGLLKAWANQNFDDYTIKDGVIYPSVPEEYPSARWVKSGNIPDYIKVIAIKPFELIEEGDEVTDTMNEYYYVVEKIAWNDPDIKDKVNKRERDSEAYDSMYRQHIENEVNLVEVETHEQDRTPKHHLFLYDADFGVVATFIYNGNKF